MSKRFRIPLMLALALGSEILAIAGGFWISIQNPSTVTDAVTRDAVVLVRADGCHNPAEASITAIAEGRVNGVRRSIPLKLAPVSQLGTYAVIPQWPAEGVWVLHFNATNLGRDAGALVRLVPGKFQKQSAELFQRKITTEDVESALKSAAD
jgi:hypothetical protein